MLLLTTATYLLTRNPMYYLPVNITIYLNSTDIYIYISIYLITATYLLTHKPIYYLPFKITGCKFGSYI